MLIFDHVLRVPLLALLLILPALLEFVDIGKRKLLFKLLFDLVHMQLFSRLPDHFHLVGCLLMCCLRWLLFVEMVPLLLIVKFMGEVVAQDEIAEFGRVGLLIDEELVGFRLGLVAGVRSKALLREGRMLVGTKLIALLLLRIIVEAGEGIGRRGGLEPSDVLLGGTLDKSHFLFEFLCH
jgi:hypothetical protein